MKIVFNPTTTCALLRWETTEAKLGPQALSKQQLVLDSQAGLYENCLDWRISLPDNLITFWKCCLTGVVSNKFHQKQVERWPVFFVIILQVTMITRSLILLQLGLIFDSIKKAANVFDHFQTDKDETSNRRSHVFRIYYVIFLQIDVSNDVP